MMLELVFGAALCALAIGYVLRPILRPGGDRHR